MSRISDQPEHELQKSSGPSESMQEDQGHGDSDHPEKGIDSKSNGTGKVEGGAFTGRARRRTTKKSVAIADILARIFISFGGIGTIIAVMGVCIFLVAVVIPLFYPAKFDAPIKTAATWVSAGPVHVEVDEYRKTSWALFKDGRIRLHALDDGTLIKEYKLFEPGQIRSTSFATQSRIAAFGLNDGSVHLIKIEYDIKGQYINKEAVPEEVLAKLDAKTKKFREDHPERFEDKERIPAVAIPYQEGSLDVAQGQYRLLRLNVEAVTDVSLGDKPVLSLGHIQQDANMMIVAVHGDEKDGLKLSAMRGTETDDFLTGGKTVSFDEDPVELPFKPLAAGAPMFLGVNGPGSHIYAAWESGELLRVNFQNKEKPFIAETGRLIPKDRRLTKVAWVLGSNTLLWGDDQGGVFGGFALRIDDLVKRSVRYRLKEGDDKFAHFNEDVKDKLLFDRNIEEEADHVFARTKTLRTSGSPLTSVSPSMRSRLVFCGFGDGHVRLFNPTSESELGYTQIVKGKPIDHIVFAPKQDGVIAIADSSVFKAGVDPLHPEASMGALFTRVWYEGYDSPTHTWQSSSGANDAEPKYGLIPLVFGTLKATFYAMLFGAPIALFAAIFSSEFLTKRAKSVIKPTIELMASLPSVVLGFIAALVLAPVVNEFVPVAVASFLLIPVTFLLFAQIWQMLPTGISLPLGNWRPLIMFIPLAVGVLLAWVIGPLAEELMFAGSIRDWVSFDPLDPPEDKTYASAVGGWVLLMLPVSALIAAFLVSRFVNPIIRYSEKLTRRSQVAFLDLIKFGSAIVLTILLAVLFGFSFDGMGLDPRGELSFWGINFAPAGTYIQGNSMILGFVMGFAIIPLIYTIADDALTAVPEHLRSASLGAGATPWQTAVRIVVPTAMSGLFSALMIGLGRAVGETMIVLMATGNTPILEFNIFNGLRTLSANIAVELPEAEVGSTHYRILFLVGLVLFVMTFIINTIAEAVRLRFRKKAVQL